MELRTTVSSREMNLEAISIWRVLKAWSWRCNLGRKYRTRKAAGWGFISGALTGPPAVPSPGASRGGSAAAAVGEEESRESGAPSQVETAPQQLQSRKRA